MPSDLEQSDLEQSGQAGPNAISFRAEELSAQWTALIGRIIALVLLAVFTTFTMRWPLSVYLYSGQATAMLLGLGAFLAAKSSWGRTWHQYAFVTADFMLVTFILVYPNPFYVNDFPVQAQLRFGTFIYMFVFLAGLTYAYRPALVLWGGVSCGFAWLLGCTWVFFQPGTVWRSPRDRDLDYLHELLPQMTYFDIGGRAQEIVVFIIVAALLALSVKRARTIALRQAQLARERQNLSRYFPSKTAALVANKTELLTEPRELQAGILFADLVAFTGWSQRHSPRETIALLREVQGMLTEVVFRHDGTLDKFIGDGVMATFGTPEAGPKDATNALEAAMDMAESFQAWRRTHPNYKDMKLAIGVHYGAVVIGDIGSKERMEFAVLGDSVNVAARLEQATRDVGCQLLVSDDLAQAALREGADLSVLNHPLDKPLSLVVYGREGDIAVFPYSASNGIADEQSPPQ